VDAMGMVNRVAIYNLYNVCMKWWFTSCT